MPELGYSLSSEEFAPNQLVRLAQRAEQTGFSISAVRIGHLHDDNEPVYGADSQIEQRSVEVSMRLSVEYPDGRHETIGRYSDLWVKSQGVWYFAANRRGPYE